MMLCFVGHNILFCHFCFVWTFSMFVQVSVHQIFLICVSLPNGFVVPQALMNLWLLLKCITGLTSFRNIPIQSILTLEATCFVRSWCIWWYHIFFFTGMSTWNIIEKSAGIWILINLLFQDLQILISLYLWGHQYSLLSPDNIGYARQVYLIILVWWSIISLELFKYLYLIYQCEVLCLLNLLLMFLKTLSCISYFWRLSIDREGMTSVVLWCLLGICIKPGQRQNLRSENSSYCYLT